MNRRKHIIRAQPAFNPLNLLGSANLLLWLQADDAATLFTDTGLTTPASVGQAVAGWKDKSGNGMNFTQATGASCPVRQTNGLSFDGTDDGLVNAGVGLLPTGANPCEIWIIARNDNTGATAGHIFSYGGTAATNRRTMQRNLNTVSRFSALTGTGAASPSVTWLQDTFDGWLPLHGNFGATTQQIDVPMKAPNISGSAVPAISTTTSRIGQSTAGGNFWQGRILEIMVTVPMTDAASRLYLRQYLHARTQGLT